jgi:hypothetical protein
MNKTSGRRVVRVNTEVVPERIFMRAPLKFAVVDFDPAPASHEFPGRIHEGMHLYNVVKTGCAFHACVDRTSKRVPHLRYRKGCAAVIHSGDVEMPFFERDFLEFPAVTTPAQQDWRSCVPYLRGRQKVSAQ